MPRILALYRDAFRGLSREVWLLSFFLFVNRSGTMVLCFLVLYLTEKHGYGTAQAGQVLGLYGAGAVVGIAVGGWLVDRIGFRAVQIGCMGLGGVGFMVFGLLPPGWTMSVGAVLLGLVAEGFRPANGAAISAFSRPENRARAFGLNRLALNLGFTVGPAIGGVLADVDFQLLFWVDGATCIAAAVGMALVLPKTPRPERAPAKSKAEQSPWTDRLFLCVFVLLLLQGLVFFQVMSTYPLHLNDVYGYPKSWVGAIVALNAAVIVAVEMPLVKAIEGRDPMRLMGLAALLTGVGFGLLPLSGSLAWVVALVLVWTLGEMMMAPMSIAWVANRASERSRGAYMAAFGISFSLCSAVAPVLGTGVYERLGPNVVWWGCLGLGVVVWAGFHVLSAREREKMVR